MFSTVTARWTLRAVIVLMLMDGLLIGWAYADRKWVLVAVNVGFLCVNCWMFVALSTVLGEADNV